MFNFNQSARCIAGHVTHTTCLHLLLDVMRRILINTFTVLASSSCSSRQRTEFIPIHLRAQYLHIIICPIKTNCKGRISRICLYLCIFIILINVSIVIFIRFVFVRMSRARFNFISHKFLGLLSRFLVFGDRIKAREVFQARIVRHYALKL